MNTILQEFLDLYGATEIMFNATKKGFEQILNSIMPTKSNIKMLETHVKSLKKLKENLELSFYTLNTNLEKYPSKIKEKVLQFKILNKKINELIEDVQTYISVSNDNNISV